MPAACRRRTSRSRAARAVSGTRSLVVGKIAIVGLGGTGGYLLDFLAKTPVVEIHLYDDDIFGTHNAFRAPGAASLDQRRAAVKKVDYYAEAYGRMRRGIRPHPVRVTADNVSELLDVDVVFLTMDSGPEKKTVVEALAAGGVPFIDTGIGVSNDLQSLLLGCRYCPRDDEGDPCGDAAEHRDSGDHDCRGDEATGDGDGHVISVADRREGGEGPPQAVAPRPDGASRHPVLRQPRAGATQQNYGDSYPRHNQCHPDDGGAAYFASTRLHYSPPSCRR